MKISIVIPVYNISPKLFVRCLKSILFQLEEDDDEIVVVDDGSNSKISYSYNKICKKDRRISYFRQENLGVSSARNKGVEIAKGEYILFVDADDYITDKCVEQAKEVINMYHPDIVFGCVYKDFDDEGCIRYKSQPTKPEQLLLSNKNDIARILNHMIGYKDDKFRSDYGGISDGPCCRFFRKTLFERAKFDSVAKWNEDTLWNIELLYYCNTAVICKSCWYIYAVRKGSAMQGYRPNCYEEFLYITKKEKEVGNKLWNTRINKGISYRIWHDIFILSRGCIFHKYNTRSFFEKYNVLKGAIECESYQNAIRCVDFAIEHRKSRKIIKSILNSLMKYKLYFVVYIIINIYTKK